ncbi:MAG: VOC family protein [Candidatus Lokiarchaeota archaeon]
MSESNLPLNIGDLKVFQYGYVYKDIKKQAEIMEKLWGMPKFALLGNNTGEVIYRGVNSTYSTSICFSRYWGKQIELIQWISGEGIHKEFIDKGKEGFHHVSCIVDNLDPYINDFEERDIEAVFIGNIGKQYFAYFDTVNSLGFFLELQTTLRRKTKK